MKWILPLSFLSIAAGWMYQVSTNTICYEKLGFIYLGNIIFWILLVNPIRNLNQEVPFKKWLVTNLLLSLFFVLLNQAAVNVFIQSLFLICFNCSAKGTILDFLQMNHFLPNVLIYWFIVSYKRYHTGIFDSPGDQKDHVIIKQSNTLKKVGCEEILWMSADNNAVNIHTKSARFVQYEKLKKYAAELKQNNFIRVHKSFLVTTAHITGFKSKSSGDGVLILTDGSEVKVSRNFKQNLNSTPHFSIL